MVGKLRQKEGGSHMYPWAKPILVELENEE